MKLLNCIVINNTSSSVVAREFDATTQHNRDQRYADVPLRKGTPMLVTLSPAQFATPLDHYVLQGRSTLEDKTCELLDLGDGSSERLILRVDGTDYALRRSKL